MIVILFWRFNPFQVFIMFCGEVELIFRILSVVSSLLEAKSLLRYDQQICGEIPSQKNKLC